MSFLDFDTNVPALTVLPEGEAKLRILHAEVKNSKKGDPMIALRFDDPSEPNASEILHFLMVPTSSDDEKQRNNKLRRINEFCDAFGIDRTRGYQIDDDLIGMTGWALLGIEHSDEYGDQNKIKRFIVGA